MSDQTGNEPELSGARRRHEAQQFEDMLNSPMNFRKSSANVVVKGGPDPLRIDLLIKRVEKRLADLDAETKDAPQLGGQERRP